MGKSEEYIDAYFKQQLSEDEKRQFEERCLNDDLFAKEVAFYITLEEGIRQKLLNQKKQQWSNFHNTESATVVPLKKAKLISWLPYLSAACLLLVIAGYYLLSLKTPQKFASRYVRDHLTLLSQTMNASHDSMQQGIAAFNNKNYDKALQLFEKIDQTHPEKSITKKFIGLVYLITKDYDKALQQFNELTYKKNLYRNPGMFLKAVTLLQRNKKGDKDQAKRLLENVVNEKAEGSREAKKWLEKW